MCLRPMDAIFYLTFCSFHFYVVAAYDFGNVVCVCVIQSLGER
ncbi:hypothetical protein MUK42_37559 [Musa troglodytarum]|uniref:Uncharacterized protein n=1 Tax=Musa troglodytarum TaxID=320322 RepID=A0A9E7H4M2_9LILI|nr:hypothetical protein MUK42_37559 [Musa troglodytarum]